MASPPLVAIGDRVAHPDPRLTEAENATGNMKGALTLTGINQIPAELIQTAGNRMRP
jgi:hypothetical protein